MTTIYCTGKLERHIGASRLQPGSGEVKSPYGDWNANLVYLNRKKHLILVNNLTFYCLIAENIKKADLSDFQSFFLSLLASQLHHDKIIARSDFPRIAEQFAPVHLSRTNNDKKTLGTMNQYAFDFEVYRTHPVWFDADIREINGHINTGLAGAGRNETRKYGRPIEDMKLLIHKDN